MLTFFTLSYFIDVFFPQLREKKHILPFFTLTAEQNVSVAEFLFNTSSIVVML